MTRDPHTFFFVHVMKTGGTTFGQHIFSNFPQDEVYPDKAIDTEPRKAYANISYLTGLPPERRARIRIFRGHFPFAVTELLGIELVTLTILRDPVERTLSYLKRRRELRDQQRSLEEIYEDPLLYPRFIHNHQAKMFSLGVSDKLQSFLEAVDVDERRLEMAKANLEKVDVLGLQDRFDEFLAELAHRYGWRFDELPIRHASGEVEVAPSFRRRIADDNAADVEFYAYARELYEKRRKRSSAPSALAKKEGVPA